MAQVSNPVTGRCHCGAITFTAELPVGLTQPIRCTCSLCRMRGGVVVMAQRNAFHITAGAEYLAEYRFNTGAALHHFCKICGVYTHHQRRFDPSQFAINAACLDGVSPFDFAEVPVVDGINHPHDGDGVMRVIGMLRFEPIEPVPLDRIRG